MQIGKRSRNVILNTAASALMKVASLACSLVMVPITIGYLNPENYGIWMAITSVLYWFAFMDVGLGNGMRNYMSEALSKGDKEKARSYFSTAMVFLTAIALAIALISIPCIYLLDLNSLFNTHSVGAGELAGVMVLAVSFSLMQFVVKNVGMVYIAMQKYAVNDLIIFLGNVVSLLIIYILILTTEANLAYVVMAFTAVPVVMFLVAAIPLLRKYPYLTPSLYSIDTATAKSIVSKGLGFFVIQITSCLVIFGSANVLISHYCGPEQVTVYNIAYKLFNVLIIGYTILISPLWNAYTDAAVKGDYGWIRKSFCRSLQMWCLSVAAGLVALALSGWFFGLWIGDSVTVPFTVSACILAYVCMFNLNNCATYLINGMNRIRVQIITSLAVTAVYLAGIATVRGEYGIEGISLLMVASYLVMSIVHICQCYMLINQKAKGIWNK